MAFAERKIAFIVAATDQGTFIVNRFDYNFDAINKGYGVGYELLDRSSREPAEVGKVLSFLDLRRKYFGDGVVTIDCGANIGVHTVECARHMTGWGTVLAIEAQERVYYALAGNIALNNCFNARAMHAAIARQVGTLKIPTPNHLAPASFGSLELMPLQKREFIGQPIDYANNLVEIPAVSLDALGLARLDLVKIDVEGMEFDVLEGAAQCIAKFRPIIVVEWLKTGKDKLAAWLKARGYVTIEDDVNLFAVHSADRALGHVKLQ